MKPFLRLVLKPVGDYPDCKYMGDWDALCATQQRAFHGQSADPLTGVQLRQCNPKLFNQITRAWAKNSAFELCMGVYVLRYEFQCQCDYVPLNPDAILQEEMAFHCYQNTGEGQDTFSRRIIFQIASTTLLQP